MGKGTKEDVAATQQLIEQLQDARIVVGSEDEIIARSRTVKTLVTAAELASDLLFDLEWNSGLDGYFSKPDDNDEEDDTDEEEEDEQEEQHSTEQQPVTKPSSTPDIAAVQTGTPEDKLDWERSDIGLQIKDRLNSAINGYNIATGTPAPMEPQPIPHADIENQH